MSISLNDHEDRIKALENKHPEWETLTTGVVNIPTGNWVKICDYDMKTYYFGMIGVDNAYVPGYGSKDNIHIQFLPLNGHQCEFVAWDLDPMVSAKEKMMIRVDQGSVYGRSLSDNSEPDNYVVWCWGLRL